MSVDEEPQEEFDFLIMDRTDAVTQEQRERIASSGAKLCILQNPMQENCSENHLTVINKPLYSLNFCQLLNHEDQIYQSNAEKELSFVAPQANVLVVDDNEMNRKVALGLMAPYEMQIDTAENGKQALQMIQSRHYDIVFMDHMMPVMDGIEATERLREMDDEYFQSLVVIALSANATAEARENFLQAKMNDFESKPIRIRELTACLLKWLPEELVTMQTSEGTVTGKDADGACEERELPQLLKLYKSYQPILKPFAHVQGNQKCVSTSQLVEILHRMHQAVDDFDLDAADAAMKELEGCELPVELQPLAEQLGAYVADVAMEDVMRLTDEMCEMLHKI